MAEPARAATLPPERALQARSLMRAGLLVIGIGFVGLGTWAAVAPLAGAIVAGGVVRVDTNRKTVQHQEGGIVRAIKVKDGDTVRRGQPLILLEDERVAASVDVIRTQLDSELARGARLEAERDGRARVTFPAELTKRASDPRASELMRAETTFFNARRQSLEEQIRLLRAQAREAQVQVVALQQEVKAEEDAIVLMREELEANERLVEQGFIQKTRILGLKRAVTEYQARHGEHLADLSSARQKISDLELRIVNLRNQYLQTASDDLTQVQSRTLDLRERMRPVQDAADRQVIAAPLDGTVVDLKVFTPGGVIGPREPLMDIVPSDPTLLIEARVGVEDIDELQPGMPVDVRLTAYKRRTMPLVPGTVTYVSADRLTDRATGQPYYVAHIQVDPAGMAQVGPDIKLSPGMPAEVYITTRQRTALDYLLEPVTDTLRRSFREP